MRRLTHEDMIRANVPEALWYASREQFRFSMGQDKLERYMENLSRVFRPGDEAHGLGFWVWGPTGIGKSSVAAVVAKASIASGRTALFMPVMEIVRAKIERRMFDEEEGTTLWQRAHVVDLLVLDDIGKEFRDDKGLAESTLEELMRARIGARRVTWITANVSYRRASEEKLYRESLLAAIKERVYPIRLEGPEWRGELVKGAMGSLMGDKG